MYSCNETIDMENLHRLLQSEKITEQHKVYLKKLKNTMKKESQHALTFVTTEKIGKKPTGRLYPKSDNNRHCSSLQDCPRALRGALGTSYVEIDIVNCFPTLFRQIFAQNHIPVPCQLAQYVDERDEFIAATGHDKDEVKRAFNCVMNFGFSNIPLVAVFGTCFKDSFKQLCDLPFYKKYVDLGKARSETQNIDEPYKKAVHFVGADVERHVVLAATMCLRESGYDTSTLIHDGFLVHTESPFEQFRDEVKPDLERSERYIFAETGYNVKLAPKCLAYEPSELFDDTATPMVEEDLTDARAAELFTVYMRERQYHVRKSCQTLYMYDPLAHVWNDKVDGWRKLCSECEDLGVYGRATHKQNAMWVQFEDSLKDEPDLQFEFADEAKHKMPFNDGYFDFQLRRMVEYDDDSYIHMFRQKLPWNWEPINELLQQEILDKCIYGVYGKEQGDFLLAILGRAAAGYVEDKMMYIILGNTNSGKGVFITLLEKAFGKGFVGTFNSGVLAHKVVADEAKGLSFMVALKDKRFLVGSEASRACVFDSLKINMLCSGGDTICARQNCKDEMEFKMCGTAFMFCNDMSKINGLDDSVANRLRFIEPRWSFLAGAEYQRKRHQTNVKLADDSIKTVFVKRPDVAQTFAQMVCLAYTDDRPREPTQIVQQNSDWLNAEDITETLKRVFELQQGGLVPAEDFYKKCQEIESLRHISQNKITRTMRDAFGIKVEKVTCNNSRGSRKQQRCYVGIMLSDGMDVEYF